MADRRFRILLAFLFLLGVAVRVAGAWFYAHANTADHGIIYLMVKHILEGSEAPVFFYGLPYMGAIEPYLSALLAKIFGISGFVINLGTAAMGILLLPIVYLWGRDAGGRVAGVAALLFCIVGPEFYFQFQSWADGGYAAILLVDAILIWLSIRILVAAREEGVIQIRSYFCLGLVAGVGWFLSPLIIAAFATIAILYLGVLRLRVFRWRLIYAAFAFILGSLPLLLWNMQNDWKTFDMLATQGNPGLLQGLKIFYVDRMLALLDVKFMPGMLQWISIAVYAALAAVAIGVCLYNLIWKRQTDRGLYVFGALLFIVVSSLFFTRSHLALAPAARYLLPIVPALAILLGAATAYLVELLPWRLGWIPLLFLIGFHVVEIPEYNQARREYERFTRNSQEFGDFLRKHDIQHVLTPYQVRGGNHSLNFVLDEEFVFTDLGRERYTPYAKAMEKADEIAVMNNLGKFEAFLKAAEGSSAIGGVPGLMVRYHIRPPQGKHGRIDIDGTDLDVQDGAVDLPIDFILRKKGGGDG